MLDGALNEGNGMPPAGKKLSRKGNVPLMLEMARAAAAGCGEGEGPGALLPLALLLVELRKALFFHC